MSKRRVPGDVVWKQEGHGFIGEAGWYLVLSDGHDDCMLECGDPDCQEWDTLHCYGTTTRDDAQTRIDDDTLVALGAAYHVSECSMLDEPDDAR